MQLQIYLLKNYFIGDDLFQVCTILVLNYHHRLASNHRMPFWFRSIFLQWLPWLLRMSRPGAKITRKTIYLQNKVSCNVNLDFLNPICISFKIIRFYSNNIYNLFFSDARTRTRRQKLKITSCQCIGSWGNRIIEKAIIETNFCSCFLRWLQPSLLMEMTHFCFCFLGKRHACSFIIMKDFCCCFLGWHYPC